ncbi:MAG: RimK family alpha-L-glutamate ligase [Candidatus Nanohaloarchaea archaeon]
MKLLYLGTEDRSEPFEEHFEEISFHKVSHTTPEVLDGETRVSLPEETVKKFDAAFVDIPKTNAVFGRVLLELLEEENLGLNQSSTAFFTAAKKNYLSYILKQKNIPSPDTAVIATEKASRNIEKQLSGPLIAKRYEELQESEKKRLDTVEEIQGFAEGSEYEEDILIFQEFDSGKKIKCLVLNDRVVSLQDNSEEWNFKKDSLQYTNISEDKKKIALDAANALGAPIVEITLRGEKVFDMEPFPDLELYQELSGKTVYQKVAEILKE